MSGPIRILGLDPGLRRTGWGVICLDGSRLSHLEHGVIRPEESLPLYGRLLALFREVRKIVNRFNPDEAAVEESFATANGSSTLKLGHARAAAMIAAADAGLSVAEYAARAVKQALAGSGAAEKHQVAFMVSRLLPTAGTPSADAADALAVAITHAHSRTEFSSKAMA